MRDFEAVALQVRVARDKHLAGLIEDWGSGKRHIITFYDSSKGRTLKRLGMQGHFIRSSIF